MHVMPDYNPFLSFRPSANEEALGGRGRIEHPDEAQNIVWQTRAASPSAYENRLGDALETIFGEGVEDLAGVVRRLNEMGVMDPTGAPWTEASFQDEMKRLGS